MEVDRQLMEAAKMKTSKEWEKLVIILLDEMYIKEDLVYDKHEGVLVGFADLGYINNQDVLAKSVMTFMVKGVFSSLRY